MTCTTLPSRISAPHLHCTRAAVADLERQVVAAVLLHRAQHRHAELARLGGDLHLRQRALLVRRQHERMFACGPDGRSAHGAGRGLAPELLQAVVAARVGREDVHHAVEVVEQDPARLALRPRPGAAAGPPPSSAPRGSRRGSPSSGARCCPSRSRRSPCSSRSRAGRSRARRPPCGPRRSRRSARPAPREPITGSPPCARRPRRARARRCTPPRARARGSGSARRGPRASRRSLDEISISGMCTKVRRSAPVRPATLRTISSRAQPTRATAATRASSSTRSGSCQSGSAAAWSPPRMRVSSSSGDALAKRRERVRGVGAAGTVQLDPGDGQVRVAVHRQLGHLEPRLRARVVLDRRGAAPRPPAPAPPGRARAGPGPPARRRGGPGEAG